MVELNEFKTKIMEQQIGPPQISFSKLVLKVLAAMAGGVLGTLILLLVIVLSSSLLNPILNPQPDQPAGPIFVFVLMIMIFLSSTVANMLSTFLLSLTETEKYKRRSSALYQVFIIHIIIFLLMVPVYFITASIDTGITVYAVALHIVISAQVSALILEIVSNYKYSLVGLYGVTFSILISAAVIFGLAKATNNNAALILLSALPVVWGSIAFTQSVTTMIYSWIAEIYDKDFLSTETVYGRDYGKEVESEEPVAPKAKDEEGADFLRHN